MDQHDCAGDEMIYVVQGCVLDTTVLSADPNMLVAVAADDQLYVQA